MSKRLRKPPPPPAPVRLLRLKVELQHAQPAIWRQVELSASLSLAEVHVALQILMGWDQSHLWQFEKGDRVYSSDDFSLDIPGMSTLDADTVQLGEVITRARETLAYTYDFGDNWRVKLRCEAIVEAAPGGMPPRCLAGSRAGPPEDCGGIGGLDNLLHVFAKPRKNGDDRELLDWAGEDWDPAAFDIDAVNARLAAVFKPARRP